MSYGITAYAVDVNRLKALIESNDDDILSRITAEFSEDIAQLNEEFQDHIDDGEPSLEEALAKILSGNCEDVEPENAQYGYAMEIICKAIGLAMYPDRLTQLSIDWISNLPQINELGIMAGSLQSLVPMPLDFPGIGCIDNAQIQEKLSFALKAMNEQKDEENKECYLEYINWLNEAKKRNAGLVTFLY